MQAAAYNLITNEQLEEVIQRVEDVTVAGTHGLPDCLEVTFAYTKRPQIRVNGYKRYCSVLVCLQEARTIVPDYQLNNDMEASHFWCHNQYCVNSKHLCFEEGNYNKSRLYCRIFKRRNNFVCLHEPPCKED